MKQAYIAKLYKAQNNTQAVDILWKCAILAHFGDLSADDFGEVFKVFKEKSEVFNPVFCNHQEEEEQ